MPGTEDCCYLCNECSKSFASLDELESHIQKTHAENIVKDNNSNQIAALEQMEVSISSIMESQSTNSPSSSDISEDQSENGNQKNSYTCRFCPKVFEDRGQLNIHYTHTHRDKPQYVCETCHMVFGVKRELSTHMRIHSGEQPHKCTQCQKEFGTRQLLKKHWMWHTGERSHVCPHCQKAFFQKGHLTQHLMIHAGGRPHQCHLCQKTFIFKFDLNRHMKIHAERGFNCGKCGRSFQKNTQLSEHEIKCKASPSTASPIPLSNGGGKMKGNHTSAIINNSHKNATNLNSNNMGSLNLSLSSLFNSKNNSATAPSQPTNSPLNLSLNTQSPLENPLHFQANIMAHSSQNLIAQMLLAQLGPNQRSSNVLQSNNYSCQRCPQTFNDNSGLALHTAITHYQNNNNNNASNSNEESKLTALFSNSPSSIQLNQIKLEEHSDSSCASSPQKASPVSDNFSSASSASDVNEDSDNYKKKFEDISQKYSMLQQQFDLFIADKMNSSNGETTNSNGSNNFVPQNGPNVELNLFNLAKLLRMKTDS
uniref:Protein krueppel n=1 Tax=Rhabditophanes sp. KR3021 TaxID=114890 RepID=A0AC35U5V6_9BILA